MPTERRVEGATVEISEKVERLGDDVVDVIGPQEEDSENENAEEEIGYYILIESNESRYYIYLSTAREYASVVYPYETYTHIGALLSKEEIESFHDEDVNWEDSSSEEIQIKTDEAAAQVINNTSADEIWQATFNLSAYASTSFVEYYPTQYDSGFPHQFQCTRVIFPFTEDLSLKYLDSRITPTIVAGKRGKRYVESAIYIDKEDKDPKDYVISNHF
jgi:hypothetical protein